MTHREIAARAAIAYWNGTTLPSEKCAEKGIDFADTFERIYAERTKATPATEPSPEGAVELVRELVEEARGLFPPCTVDLKGAKRLLDRAEAWLSRQPTGPTREEQNNG